MTDDDLRVRVALLTASAERRSAAIATGTPRSRVTTLVDVGTRAVSVWVNPDGKGWIALAALAG
jgi:hypothetical protein